MRILSCALLTLCIAFPANADSDQDARVAVAKDYVQATMTDTDVQDFITQLWKPMIEQMAANRQPMTPEQIEEIGQLFSSELTEPLTNVMLQQDEVMADIMTLDELTALRDFYTSEHGGAVMRKMPQLAQIQQPMISAVLQKAMPEMMPKIEAITAPK